ESPAGGRQQVGQHRTDNISGQISADEICGWRHIKNRSHAKINLPGDTVLPRILARYFNSVSISITCCNPGFRKKFGGCDSQYSSSRPHIKKAAAFEES